MSNNVCKKCGKALPEEYKHKKCENCRNKDAKNVRNWLTAIGTPLTVVLFMVTKGKVNLKK